MTAAQGFSELGLTWSLLSEQRAGRGRVVWLVVAPASPSIAMDPAALFLEETRDVPRVRVTNRSPSPTLLPANHLLFGGLQTRVVERSVVLGPSSVAFVPVRCVEQDRWRPHATADAATFRTGERLSIPASATLSRAKGESMRATGVYSAPQHGVWKEVTAELTRERTTSVTSSYEAVSHVRRARVAAARVSITPPRFANAMLVLPDAGGAWLEAFATPEALACDAASVAADLFGEAVTTHVARRVGTVGEAVDWIWRRRVAPLKSVPGTLGDAHALVSERASGEIVLLDGRLAHAMVTASLGVSA